MSDDNKDQNNGKLGKTLVLSSINRINPDIGRWRRALRAAESIQAPFRPPLYDIHEETMLDGVVTAVTQRILLKCTNAKMVFMKEGQDDDEHPVSKMIESPDFLEFIQYIVEAKWWGHSLIEFEFEEDGIKSIELIPRKNVIPEKAIVVEKVGQTKGIAYGEPPYCNYLVEVGKPRDLGLLNKAAPYAIYKKLGFGNFGEYVERFGVPIMEFQYDSQNPNAKREVEKQAANQGASSTIIMPDGTTSVIHKGADGSGSTVFKDYKAANDEEILLIFLLQTMTTKDGSSRSQAEVHAGGESELIAGYKLFVELVLNYEFKPLLALHGFDVEGGKFKYADTERLSKTDLLAIIKGLAQFGDVPLEYIEKHFGIELSPKEKEEVQEKQLKLKKKSRYGLACCNEQLSFRDMEALRLNDEDVQGLLGRVYKSRGKAKFDGAYYTAIAQHLIGGLDKAWTSDNIDYDSPDHLAQTLLELNTFRFSATKDLALLSELNEFVSVSDTFEQFKERANTVIEDYNVNYLQTEYNLAVATAQSSADYIRNLEQAEDFPYWEYQTVGDDRVRASHAALDGMLFKAGETSEITPPNGYNCRCIFVPRSTKGGKNLSTVDDATEVLGAEYEKMKEAGFNVNRAELLQVFTEKQHYVSRFKEDNLSFKDFDLAAYSVLVAKAKKAKVTKRTASQAKDWFAAQVGKNGLKDNKKIRLLDYNGRPIHLDLKTLSSNKAWNVLDLLPTTLQNPDEVYFVRKGQSSYKLTLIQYYDPNPLVIEILQEKDKQPKVLSWNLERSANKFRKGLLIKKS